MPVAASWPSVQSALPLGESDADSGIGPRAPVPACAFGRARSVPFRLIANTLMKVDARFGTYMNLPSGVTAGTCGKTPVGCSGRPVGTIRPSPRML